MPVVDLSGLPDWGFLLAAFASTAVFLSASWWVSSPPARRHLTVGPGVAVVLFVVCLVRSLHDRPMLWFTTICCTALAAWLVWMGPMPPDMPGATDPECRLHPDYARVARRGRIAGLAWVATSAVLVIATLVWVKVA